MNTKTMSLARRIPLLSTALLMLTLSMTASAAAPLPQPGTYCITDNGTLSLVVEELSVTLDFVLHSQSLEGKDKLDEKFSSLQSAGVTLQLASSRGSGRILTLIDAIIAARANEDYSQQLLWFPLLRASMLDFPEDARTRAAHDSIDHAESIMQEDGKDDPMQYLHDARHMLACDALHQPLQEAGKAQRALARQFSQRKHVTAKAYKPLIKSLHSALLFALQYNENPSPAVP